MVVPGQIAGLLKDNEKISASPAAAPTDDDSEIKKIKKVKHETQTCYILKVQCRIWWTWTWSASGPELPARLDLQEEVEDHHPGLHPLAARGEHEEEEPGGVQHVGLRGRVRAAASHPGQQLPEAAPHGRQLQETPHHPRWCQQHLPQQVRSAKIPYE